MQPFDLLTDEDKELIKEYCISYASVEPSSVEEVLSAWNKNKKKLLKIFGNQLRISIPIEVETNQNNMMNKYKRLYLPLNLFDSHDVLSYKKDIRNHDFINSLGLWLKDTYEYGKMQTVKQIVELTKYYNYEIGKTNRTYIFNGGKTGKDLKIPAGTKILRAFRKVLEYYNFPYMDDFEKWRDDLSVISTDKKIKSELVFSIHPIDFMTMSDNRCGWTSCMSWINHGGYSTGTIEMLNSNLAVVVYLKSKDINFTFNDFDIPNKSWRALMFVHKNILLIGKHYPYQSEIIAKTALDEFQKILKRNIGWTYQYKNQKYFDMLRSYNNHYVKCELSRLKEHKIFTYTNIMYNDILEDHSTDYWCCRNYVKKSLYLNLSGKATCMCCGKPIDKYGYDEIDTTNKFCIDCYNKFGCLWCRRVSKHNEFVTVMMKTYRKPLKEKICVDCLQNDYYFDIEDKVFVDKQRFRLCDSDFDKTRYKNVTREVIKENEICSSIY